MKKKPIKVLIPNVTSSRNVGDEAMLETLITLVKQVNPDAVVTVHSNEPTSHPQHIANAFDWTLYFWAVFSSKKKIRWVWRLILLTIQYVLCKFNLPWYVSKELKKLVMDYKNADLVVFVGGGYIRSKLGVTQALNLVMQLVPFLYARLFSAKTIVAPISFGPFAYEWQEKICAYVIRQQDIVTVREAFSYEAFKKYLPDRLILSADHALLTQKISKEYVKKTNTIGFTIKSWLSDSGQKVLEDAYYQALKKVSIANKLTIHPIVQVDSPEFGDVDYIITENIAKKLERDGIKVLPITKILSVEHATQVYNQLNLLLGMRMHSNILAATQHVPFVAVSYEYKTEGIAEYLGLKDYCIPCDKVSTQSLLHLIEDAFLHRETLTKVLTDKLLKIQKEQQTFWLHKLTNQLQ